MTVNPYLTQEYDTSAAPTPQPRAAKSDVVGGRKTNRVAMTGAMIGLLIALSTASFPDLQAIAPFDRGRAIGYVVGRIIGAMLLGYSFGWWLGLLFSRPAFALLLFGGTGAVGGAIAVRGGLPSVDSIGLSRNGSMDSIPLSRIGPASMDSISSTSKPVDLARHQEARRVQFDDEAFSVILPPNWKQMEREPDHVIYAGSTGVAFPGSVGLQVHPKPRRLTIDVIQDSIVKSTRGFVSFIDSGELTIDEKHAFFVACHVRLKGQNIREVVYLVLGESKLYELTVACHEPPTASSRNTLSRVVQSLRVD